MDKHTICLLNDSFPPIIDGVANAVVNYAENIEKHHGHAVVVTPAVPGADDSGFPFPVVRYPSIDTRRLVGYVAGYPFSPETALRVREEKVELLHTHCPIASAILARSLREVVDAPLVLTYHTKYDIDIAKAVKSKLLQESAIRALVQNVNACDEVWVVSRGAGENLRSLGYEGAYTVMENGVDVPRGRVSDAAVTAASAGYDLPDGVPLFLFVGRLMWYKGLHAEGTGAGLSHGVQRCGRRLEGGPRGGGDAAALGPLLLHRLHRRPRDAARVVLPRGLVPVPLDL